MGKILVAGLINLETTLQVEGFPIGYSPVRYPFFGVNSTISGVGYNVAKALTTLGDEVRFAALVGNDPVGRLARETLVADRIPTELVLAHLPQTPQSVIQYDREGRRQINVDLKNIQETADPAETFEAALAGCDLAVLCNINFARPFLATARRLGVPIATDVHTIASLDDDYNRDFMTAAEILFMSDESLPCSPEEWAWRVQARYGPKILVIGLGASGALLALKDSSRLEYFPAVGTRPVVNTIGAGDALFSAFVHFYACENDPRAALQKAIVFASYKIGEKGAAEGFLTEGGLAELYRKIYP